MLFSEIAAGVKHTLRIGTDTEILGIAYDSRKVVPRDVFVAFQGASFDGHDYIESAYQSGATAFITEKKCSYLNEKNLPYIVVEDGRRAMGEAAAAFYGYPSRKLKLVGVTGTSGKTTVTHLINSVFEANGIKSGFIGTIGAVAGKKRIPTLHTTPEPADIQCVLSEMVEEGVQVVAMEASSHGLFQGRTYGCEFDCGVFTNIARDHLDFHQTLEAYLEAKLILFNEYAQLSKKTFTAVVNADDHSYEKVVKATKGRVVSFGLKNPSNLTASNIEVGPKSVDYRLHAEGKETDVHLNIGGAFNVYNSLAAAGVAITLGLDLEQVAFGLSQASCVPGRFESIESGQDFSVIVDYAHTPDELENVLYTASQLTKGKLIVVFGCGGDRDRGKRPIMGNIASDVADIVIVTSDNPRSEDPDRIIQEILKGIDNVDSVRVNPSRKDAIKDALTIAKTGDIVVIAGKGHEDYQIVGNLKVHFDDREVAREILRELVN